jgi:Fe-S-cluster containining protein
MINKQSELCQSCGKCCKCIVLPVKIPLQKSIMEEWLNIRGCEVVAEDADSMYVKVDQPCPYLREHLNKSGDKTYTCSVYVNRPDGCSLFDGSKYDFLDCAWKDKYVVLQKSAKGWIGNRKFIGKEERKRTARRASIERKQEKKDDAEAYGESFTEGD